MENRVTGIVWSGCSRIKLHCGITIAIIAVAERIKSFSTSLSMAAQPRIS
jgi:hypothetical protein